MNRRKLLLGSGVALTTVIAGCVSDDDSEEIDGGSRNGDDDDSGGDDKNAGDDTGGDDQDTGDGNGGDDSGTGDGNGEDDNGGSDDEDESPGSADLEIVNHELVTEQGDWQTEVYVEATVENTGDAPSGDVTLQADWYDEDGNYLDNDTERLTSLGEGETWVGRVYHLGTDPEDIDDYEIEGEFSEDAYVPTEGLTLLESEMTVQGDELEIEGRVENESGEDQNYVEVVAKVYDGEGNVMGDAWDNVTDLRDGETWAFSFDYFRPSVRNRIGEAEDHEILIKDSAW